ncbi:MAG: ExeM/NucH family extracellular endonuclease, partial [Planctomycetota bacterium]
GFSIVPSGPLQWTPAERPLRPDVGQAGVTVASFNVLNYFTTIDDGSNIARGADSAAEFARQESKLVSAIIGLNADVIGLMEIENNLEAENQLVAALNKELGQEAFKGCGLPEGFESAPGGSDAIRVGIIYRSDRVETTGDVSMINNTAYYHARTPIVQGFQSKSSSRAFQVIVNHFKSKGGADRADAANKNKGDGQSAYNATRRSQALAICDYIDEVTKVDGSARVLVIGDLNAYGQEDPIDAMRARGLVDLQERLAVPGESGDPAESFSYIYYGQAGSLDHAIATEAMVADITGVAAWHINSDEPRFLDYNQEYNPAAVFAPDPYRSSDHDPVLVGIRD